MLAALGPFQALTIAPTGAVTPAPFTVDQYRELDRIFGGMQTNLHTVVQTALDEDRKKAYRAAFFAGAAGVIAALITGTIAVRMVGRTTDIARRKFEKGY
jgi:hypothetical protein